MNGIGGVISGGDSGKGVGLGVKRRHIEMRT